MGRRSKDGVPRGYVPMMVGKGVEERFLVHTKLFKHPIFTGLLEMAERDQFGFAQPGVLHIPCDVEQFRSVVNATVTLALNTIFRRWGLKAQSTWNISGELCNGVAIDSTILDGDIFNPGIKCDCSYNNGTICHIDQLNFWKNYLTGSVPAFFGNFTRMQYLSVGNNALSGPIPKELGNLQRLISLGLSNNNFSGSIPPEFGNLTSIQRLYVDSSGLRGELPPTLSNLKTLSTLRLQGNSFEGPIPASFSSLNQLTELRIGDIINGSSSLEFIRDMTSLSTLVLRNCKISDAIPSNFSHYTSLQQLDLSFNNITGEVPQSLFSLSSLAYVFLGNNSLSGNLPAQKSNALMNIDLSYNQLSGTFPSWVSQRNLQLILPSGLRCLQRDFPCYRGSPNYYSFAIKCGGSNPVTASDGTVYEKDNASLSSASYFVTDLIRWAVSNVGSFTDASNSNYIITINSNFQGTLDPELFYTARLSPSSLRYYGFGLENGNYTIKLQFSEFAILDTPSWRSAGNRMFDIYIQGVQKERDFDIKRVAGGRSTQAVVKEYVAPVTNNFLEIHFFWAGKGTCCTPFNGYYGPSISAISVSPNDFNPTVSNQPLGINSKKDPKGLIAGVSTAATVLGLFVIYVTFILIQRKKRLNKQNSVLTGLDVKPYTFSYAELRAATEDFNPANVLGEGGYGQVFKGILNDGRTVAVKQLSTTSNQGKGQFLTEIATISAVQHRNLVRLHGCCVDEDKRILVYEYLENGSLDHAIFGFFAIKKMGKKNLLLGWPKRFDILLGVAKGLTYLHEESRLRIVHRDVKASNILLDADLDPKISDFGLAKLYDDKMTHMNTRVAGTIGYLAPEYALRGHLTEKADVFAFGVVALEVLSGRPNSDDSLGHETVYLLDWVWNLLENNNKLAMLDEKLESFDEEEVNRVIGVALLCTQASPSCRPTMSRVVGMLAGDVEIPYVPERPTYLLLWQYRDVTSSFAFDDTTDASIVRRANNQPSPPRGWSKGESVETGPFSSQSIESDITAEGR
ncbi:hypothetical protein ZIOFF_014741 [Zingiber officinale]|uniref:non-specific serine/threonine protein kinase n=1 Tax=Zingiber officinale TaxID=94328 RepID=A0A8J5I0V6_ZINOF|nr:hypothetical protein ZIOFF_014741 [Zingiber officinale]